MNRRLALVAALLLAIAAPALAGGVGVPTSRAGLGVGNLPEFTGLRLNFRDRDVHRVDGVNVTVWPADDRNRGAVYRGVGLNIVGNSGAEMDGVFVSLVGVSVREKARGVFVSGIGSSGGDLDGVMIAGIGAGADDLRGIAVAGLGVGCEDVSGIIVAGLGAGAEDITGIAVGGLGMGGKDMQGIMVGGLGVGGETLRGIALGGGVGVDEVQGLALSLAYQRTTRLVGVSTGIYNRADEARGLMIGLFNTADSLHGVQIGLLNHVGGGPAAARWLPLVNARF
jgi:hypothetical protein